MQHFALTANATPSRFKSWINGGSESAPALAAFIAHMEVVLAQGLDLASHKMGSALLRLHRIGLDDIERYELLLLHMITARRNVKVSYKNVKAALQAVDVSRRLSGGVHEWHKQNAHDIMTLYHYAVKSAKRKGQSNCMALNRIKRVLEDSDLDEEQPCAVSDEEEDSDLDEEQPCAVVDEEAATAVLPKEPAVNDEEEAAVGEEEEEAAGDVVDLVSSAGGSPVKLRNSRTQELLQELMSQSPPGGFDSDAEDDGLCSYKGVTLAPPAVGTAEHNDRIISHKALKVSKAKEKKDRKKKKKTEKSPKKNEGKLRKKQTKDANKKGKQPKRQQQTKSKHPLKRPAAECPLYSPCTPRRLKGKQHHEHDIPVLKGNWRTREHDSTVALRAGAIGLYDKCWDTDENRIPGLNEDQRRLALSLAMRALEPDPPQPVWQARAHCMFQREKWIWQIQVCREGRFRVACQVTGKHESKEASMLRAEVMRIVVACDMPKENLNQIKNIPWLLEHDAH